MSWVLVSLCLLNNVPAAIHSNRQRGHQKNAIELADVLETSSFWLHEFVDNFDELVNSKVRWLMNDEPELEYEYYEQVYEAYDEFMADVDEIYGTDDASPSNSAHGPDVLEDDDPWYSHPNNPGTHNAEV